MFHYIIGKITERGHDYLAVETDSGLAYLLTVSNPFHFAIGEEGKFYCHEVYGENDHYLAGFRSKEEKECFLDLISVKGIGPKTALSALGGTTPEELRLAIEGGNVSFLKKLPGIGPKAASQIVLDLKGKLLEAKEKEAVATTPYLGARDALLALGFKAKEVDKAIAGLPTGLKEEEAIYEALRSLRK